LTFGTKKVEEEAPVAEQAPVAESADKAEEAVAEVAE